MAEPLQIQTSLSLPVAEATASYTYQMQGIGGTPPYVWSLLAGAFPTGMSMNAAGLITASLDALDEAEVGEYSVTIRLTDAVLAVVDVPLTLSLEPANFRRITLAQLDARLHELVRTFYDRGVTPEMITRHFYRSLEGVIPGASLSHEDLDILVRAWPPLASADVTLRAALDSLIGGGVVADVVLANPGPSVVGVPDVIPIGASPASPTQTEMWINGVRQTYTLDFTVSGSDLTYLNAAGRYVLNGTEELTVRYT